MKLAMTTLAAAALVACTAHADLSEFDWIDIGYAGNRDTIPDEVPRWPSREIGGVDYEYRITRTQVTVQQYFEFVGAYQPFLDGVHPNDPLYTSEWIWWDSGLGTHYIEPGTEQFPANCSWRFAARYVNWIHNGKVNEKWAFEDGVYDTSTFTENPDGTVNDQPTHHADARVWIPTWDEWAKAFYYDPNRYGDGEEGYWLYPDASNESLYAEWPWNGGETNAGLDPDDGPVLDVASYPHAQSYFGLLDASGAENDWLEDLAGDLVRRLGGSHQFDGDHELIDRLDFIGGSSPKIGLNGFRIVTTIPSPCGVGVFALTFAIRRRKT